jgi:hypothetical protein
MNHIHIQPLATKIRPQKYVGCKQDENKGYTRHGICPRVGSCLWVFGRLRFREKGNMVKIDGSQ